MGKQINNTNKGTVKRLQAWTQTNQEGHSTEAEYRGTIGEEQILETYHHKEDTTEKPVQPRGRMLDHAGKIECGKNHPSHEEEFGERCECNIGWDPDC